MLDKSKSDAEKVKALKAAVDGHKKYTVYVSITYTINIFMDKSKYQSGCNQHPLCLVFKAINAICR